MPMRILALVPEAVTARRCLDAACAAMAAVDGAMEAFHVKVDPRSLVTAEDEITLQQMRVRREGTAEERAAAVRLVYDTWRRGLSPDLAERVSWREATGAEEDAVLHEALHADLVAIPKSHNMDGGDAHHAAFRRSHRPLLFVPDASHAAGEEFARRMLIAWKPTPQAQRAVEGAAVWLRRAQRVSTIMVAKSLEGGGWEDLERLSRQLGFETQPRLVEPAVNEVGEQIVEAIHDLQPDTAVLGAYRHGEMIEWALRSTTRYVQNHAKIPLFMAH